MVIGVHSDDTGTQVLSVRDEENNRKTVVATSYGQGRNGRGTSN